MAATHDWNELFTSILNGLFINYHCKYGLANQFLLNNKSVSNNNDNNNNDKWDIHICTQKVFNVKPPFL